MRIPTQIEQIDATTGWFCKIWLRRRNALESECAMKRPMSFSDRQRFIQTLAQVRNLSIACEQAASHDSVFRMQCEHLIHRIDEVSEKLIDDAGYSKVIEA